MNWSDIAESIAAYGAPVLGMALAGPAGAAVGQIIANKLDSDATPENVYDVLKEGLDSPVMRERLLELEKEQQALVRMNLKDVNETARVESRSDDKYVRRCRPTVVYTLCATAVALVVLSFLAVFTEDVTAAEVAQLVSALGLPLGILASACGVYFHNRTTDKHVAEGMVRPGLFNRVGS